MNEKFKNFILKNLNFFHYEKKKKKKNKKIFNLKYLKNFQLNINIFLNLKK